MSALVMMSLTASHVATAHHSSAQFDREKTIALQGTVETVEWTNPHVWLWVRITNSGGDADLWGFEAADVNNLTRRGWTKHTLNPGDKVTVDLHPMRDGRKAGALIKVTLADGRVLSPFDAGPPPGGPPPGSPPP